jgi:hypothetical protein
MSFTMTVPISDLAHRTEPQQLPWAGRSPAPDSRTRLAVRDHRSSHMSPLALSPSHRHHRWLWETWSWCSCWRICRRICLSASSGPGLAAAQAARPGSIETAVPPETDNPLCEAALAVEQDETLAAEMEEWAEATVADGLDPR